MEAFSPYNPETKQAEKSGRENPLITAYRLVHEKEPEPGMSLLDIADRIVEVLDNPNWVPHELALECGDEIIGLRNTDDPEYDKRAIKTIRTFEEGVAQNLLPSLKQYDEVHMDAWDVARREDQESKK